MIVIVIVIVNVNVNVNDNPPTFQMDTLELHDQVALITGETVTIDGALLRLSYSALSRRKTLAADQQHLGLEIRVPDSFIK